MARSQQQQLVVQIYAKRYAQLWLEYDREAQEHRERGRAIMAHYGRLTGDLAHARFLDLAREYPLCLNPKLNLMPKLIETKWGVLFA